MAARAGVRGKARKTARGTTGRKKAARRKKSARKSGRQARRRGLVGVELPSTLREFAGEVQGHLNGLERRVERAGTKARREAARLIREASHRLGSLQIRGESGWRRLARSSRRDLVRLLRRLESTVSPRARKAARRKSPTRTRSTRA